MARDPHVSVSRTLQPSFAKLDSRAECAFYRKRLLKLWGGNRHGTSFPGCNPRSLSRANVPSLSDGYSISLKSDGIRYALFLTMRPDTDSSAVALLVDRAWGMYEMQVAAPEEYFRRGTILEGELVWKQPEGETLLYLVFDAVVVKGENMCRLPFRERLEAAKRATHLSEELAAISDTSVQDDRALETDSIVMAHYTPTVTMRTKHFVNAIHLQRLWNKRFDADHRVDGIVLNRDESAYVNGTSPEGCMYKWKPQSTVDLLRRRRQDTTPELCSQNGPLPEKLVERAVVVRDSKVCTGSEDCVILEYLITVDAVSVTLFPLRNRADKTIPNSERVVIATVQDVVDNVTVAEMQSAASGQASV